MDDEVIVECRARRVPFRSRARRRRSRASVSAFPGRCRRATPAVSLEDVEGRGEVRLVQQPRAENDYTARVRIRDHQGGAGDYGFTLRVDAAPARRRKGVRAPGHGLERPRGRPRARRRPGPRSPRRSRGNGAPVTAERARFDRDLPARENKFATVRRLRGRGRVELVEYPSRRNGYRLVFEIDDGGGGAGDYEVEVSW